MASMTCRHFHEELERWMDGERSAAASAHVKSCAACSAILADLKSIEAEAHSWSAPLPEPPERVWISLRNQLEAEGIIKTAPSVAVPASEGWFSRLFQLVPRPAMAGAYLAAMVACAVALSVPHPQPAKPKVSGPWFSNQLVADLNAAENKDLAMLRASHSPYAADLNQGLDVVDKQIALCEKSVSEEPDNEVARDFLSSAYQQKAELLERISERGESGQ
jgi:hypothetical protein